MSEKIAWQRGALPPFRAAFMDKDFESAASAVVAGSVEFSLVGGQADQPSIETRLAPINPLLAAGIFVDMAKIHLIMFYPCPVVAPVPHKKLAIVDDHWPGPSGAQVADPSTIFPFLSAQIEVDMRPIGFTFGVRRRGI